MSKFCPNCGNALADNAMFCGSCGAKQETAPTQPPVQTAEPIYQQPAEPMYQQPAEPMYQQFDYAPPTQPKKSKKGLVIGLAVAAIAVAAALFIFLSGGKDKPYSKALDNYLNTQCMMECDDIKSLRGLGRSGRLRGRRSQRLQRIHPR